MKKNDINASQNIIAQLKNFVIETDIRILVYAPPVIGFICAFAVLLTANQITNGHLSQSFKDFILGITFLTPLCSGFAEIYKREMPVSFGKTIKGKLAIVSGVIIVIIFGFFGLATLFSSFKNLFSL